MHKHIFKHLNHQLGELELHTRGADLGLGYSPDLSAMEDGCMRLILESQPSTDQKAVIGAFLKADTFCRNSGTNATLIIVMTEKDQASAARLIDHLREFVSFWKHANTNGGVGEVLILSDGAYIESLKRKIQVLTAEFRALCQIVLERRGTSIAAVSPPGAVKFAVERRRRTDPDTIRSGSDRAATGAAMS
jgi:hypothetical protein